MSSEPGGRPLGEWVLAPEIRARLARICRRAVRGTSLDADDIQQSVYHVALRQRLTFASADDVMRWASVVAPRLVRDRTESFHGRRVEFVPDLPDHAAVADDHVDDVLAGLINADAAVRRHVETLPDLERSVVRARFYEQLKLEDTAARLGVPISTIQSTLRSALRRLRQGLTEGGYDHLAVVLPCLGRRAHRPAIAGPKVATVTLAAVAIHATLGWTTLPYRPSEPPRPPRTSVVAFGPDDAPVPGGGPETARPASPRAPRRGQAPPRTPDAGRGPGPVPRVRVDTPVGPICVGSERPSACRGDRIYYQTPEKIAQHTGPVTDSFDGTTIVQQEQVPACEAPNTPATRCEPDSHRPSR